ncbi:MAG: glycosyltransferase [Clostridiaceae bacterium]|nr:glycosyltransferase [Clostridiaceae bacterium]
MKIGIIIGSLGFGGAERVSVRLAQYWTQKGHNVIFFTTMEPPEKEYAISKEIKRCFCHTSGGGFGLIKCLRSNLLSQGPDTVVVMDTPMCVYAVPTILFTGIPFIVSERSAPNTNAIKKKTRILSHFLMRFANGYVFQTNGAKNFYSKGIQKRSTVIPNPLIASELPEPWTGKRAKKVVAMGRLIPAKNYPLMIQAFTMFAEKNQDYILEIYGDGSDHELVNKCRNASKAKERIHLNPARADVLECVRDASMFILSSDLEGMPNALIEAMALGIPSISTDCPPGGPSDLIEDGVNGLLVPVGDAVSLSKAMSRIADDSTLGKNLSHNSITLRTSLNINCIGDRWIQYMNSLLHK